MSCNITDVYALPDCGVYLMARIYSLTTGELVKQADVSAIVLKVIDERTMQVATVNPAPSVSDLIFDSLQTDSRWTKDSEGYNFAYTATAAQRPNGNRNYRYEFKLVMASGEPVRLNPYRIVTGELLGGTD